MSAGIKAATALTSPKVSSSCKAEELNNTARNASIAATLDCDVNTSVSAAATSLLLYDTDILNSDSFTFESSNEAHGKTRNLVHEASAAESGVNSENGPASCTDNFPDDDVGSAAVELRDTLSSNKVGIPQFSGANSSNSQEQLSPGLSLLQAAAASSPPPHSYRHSRAYRHFKNPPQPHMCIKTKTDDAGEELFINVLSWTRIVIPQEPSDPIPLYGGMRVPPGSPRSPPIVFAVMANPEVLKDSGRHSKDPEERRAMVELMCDFVEAMNPGVKLVRNAVILKDRDISGELKDVWNAVQAQRDREREEQMMLQRQQQQQQQQHYGGGTTTPPPVGSMPAQHQMYSKSMLGGMADMSSPPRTRRNMSDTQINENCSNAGVGDGAGGDDCNAVSLSMLSEQFDNKLNVMVATNAQDDEQQTQENHSYAHSNGNEFKESSESNHKNDLNNHLNANNCNTLSDTKAIIQNQNTNGTSSLTSSVTLPTNTASNANSTVDNLTNNAAQNAKAITTNTLKVSTNVNNSNSTSSLGTTTTNQNSLTSSQPVAVNPPPPTKKEKLGGFLPNGCIFPRFTKNNKHKDKDKEGKTKEKEKNALLSALKKSKDKKSQQASTVNANQNQEQQNELKNTHNTSANNSLSTISNITASHQQQQSSSAVINNHHNNLNNSTVSAVTPVTTTTTTTPATNCLHHLESEVQRLDINHIDGNKYSSNIVSSNNESKESASKTANSSNNINNTGVGCH